jgi:lysophospholipid acyltransferase
MSALKKPRLTFLYIICLSVRLKRYPIWLFTEAACVAAGLGTEPDQEDSNHRIHDVDNINVLKIELATNSNIFWQNWNRRTHAWLRSCIYRRLRIRSQAIRIILTFMFSGIWVSLHIVYAKYFINENAAWLEFKSRSHPFCTREYENSANCHSVNFSISVR